MGAPRFGNGTTNGAAWYPLTGGMQDYNYIWHGCMEVCMHVRALGGHPYISAATEGGSQMLTILRTFMEGSFDMRSQ